METRAKSALRTLILSLDGVLVVVSMVIAVVVHPWLRDLIPSVRATPSAATAARLTVLVLPLWLVLISLLRLDRTYETVHTRWQLFAGLARLHILGFFALAALLFFTQIVVNRSLIASFLATSFALLYLERALLARWRGYQQARGQVPDRLLLVGDATYDLLEFVRAAAAQPLPPQLVGLVSDGEEQLPLLPPRLGAADDLPRVLRDHAVDAAVFFAPYQSPTRAAEQLAVCETLGVPAHFAIELGRPNQAEPRVIALYDRPFVTYEVAPKNQAQLALKHGFDVVAAALGLLLVSPLLLVVGLAILVTMGRPILFAQERAGLRGRRFMMYKFRTMVPDAELRRLELEAQNEMGGPVFKLSADPRVTPLGRVLRRTSIDELPQLFNVLAGSMSLVGPRPLPVHEQQRIEGWHRRRLMMKPGLTCLWQVSGRNQIDFEDWMKLDLRYIDEWSLALDLAILARTVPAVLFGRGAH